MEAQNRMLSMNTLLDCALAALKLPVGHIWTAKTAQELLDFYKEYNEAAGEKWLILSPKRWNRHAWCYDPCELVPAGGAAPAGQAAEGQQKQAPNVPWVDLCVTDDEYLLD